MAGDRIQLRFAAGRETVPLRELTGHEEREVAGTTTQDALALLNRLQVSPPAGAAVDAAELVVSDRDRLLATVYQRSFGDRIDNTLTCTRCRSPFDITFSLQALLDSLQPAPGARPVKVLAPNLFESAVGVRFRLPTGKDERDLATLPEADAQASLLRRCVAEDSGSISAAELDEMLSEIAPLVDLELTARCPECGHTHALHFDIQSYLLSALLAERNRLAVEIHRLALAYGWSLGEILSLTRTERRRFVELIDNEMARGRRSPL